MKKTVVSLLLILSIIFTFAACKGNSEDDTTTTTEPTTAYVDTDMEELLNALESQVAATDGETLPITAIEPDTLPEGEKIKVDADSDSSKETLFTSYFKEVSKDKKFYMTATCSSSIDGVGMDIPLTLAVSGDKYYISMKAKVSSTMTMKMDFIVKDNKGYMVIHNMKAYAATESGDNEFVDGLVGTEFGTMKYLETTQLTSDGKKYICEEYDGGDGTTIKCYFLEGSKKPERIESLADGNTTVMKDIAFSSDVDDSLFEIPSGYKNIDQMTELY
ncbi:MAG: hypothetical protein IJF40_06785 [Clostridia bacterium]|nr:hypothetical protein [Clostridia bacterium]